MVLFVFLVKGLFTDIVPFDCSTIRVGPVYRQPPVPVSVDCLSAELLGGIVSGAA